MSAPVRAMIEYFPTGSGTSVIVAACNGALFSFDGTAATTITGATIDTSNYCVMVVAKASTGFDRVYVIDAAGDLFSTDGTTAQAENLLDAGAAPITGLQDMVWFLGRMWYSAGDFIYFSDVALGPTDIVDLPLVVKAGDGEVVRRILTYRQGLLLIFKYGRVNSRGSIHLADVSSNDPAFFSLNVLPQFEGINLCSPRCVTRMGFDQNAEVIFATVEGLRTEQFTALDRLIAPSLPISENVIADVKVINHNYRDEAHSIVFLDELFWWIPEHNEQFPNLCLAYQTKIPKESPLNGWTRLDLMNATCSCIASLGDDPHLYIGTKLGMIERCFAVWNNAEYIEIGKRIDWNEFANDKLATRLTVTLAPDHKGTIVVSILYDDGKEFLIGSYTPIGGGITFPITFPLFFKLAQLVSVPFDLHYEELNGQRRRGKDFRIKMTSIARPAIYGYQFEAIIYPTRTRNVEADAQVLALTSTAISPGSVTAQSLNLAGTL